MKRRFVLTALFLVKSFSLFGNDCVFSVDSSLTKVQFAAFKFTEKTRVEGKFDSIQIIGNPSASTLSELGRKVKFSIDINSLNTGNPDRDGKIKKFFFGEMKNTQAITGYFRNIRLYSNNGQAELILKMNQRERSVPVSFTLSENDLNLKGKIDVLDWNAQKSLESLNRECNALHTGKDGVSKLWSEVEIFLTTQLKKSCK
ncbi:MAG: YceI family protein [Leptospiraceae bacterium]|nr:YceI family protein [Leptospiraceae bacterium]